MNLLRRAVTVPLTTVLMACVLVSAPLLLAISAVVGLATDSSRPIRTVAVTVAYAAIELRTLAHLLRGQRDGDQLVSDFLDTAYTVVRRILDVEVVLDTDSAAPELIPRDDPVIVMSRHCGPGDSVLVAWLLLLSGTRCGCGWCSRPYYGASRCWTSRATSGACASFPEATVPVGRFTIRPRH